MKYPDDFINKVICGKSPDMLNDIPDKSIDLVLTDPPYGLRWKQKIDLKGRKSMYHHKETTEEWDNGFDIKEFYDEMFKHFDRLVKEIGSVVMFTRAEFISYAIESAKKNNFDIKSTIIWHKTNPSPQIRKKNYLSSFETILWVARHDEKKCLFTFNFTKQKDMHNFIETPICMGGERTVHPTQKPMRVIENLLMVHSNEGDVVLDPFLGSGTTAKACKELGRKYIGIELNPEYCKLAEDRLRQEVLF